MTHNRGPNGNQALDTGPTPPHPCLCEPFAAALDHTTPDGETIFAEFLVLHAMMVVLKVARFTAKVIRDKRALLGRLEQLVRALYTHRLRGLVAVLPSDLTAEILAASEKITGVVRGFTQN